MLEPITPIRISCGSLCRIHSDQRYLFVLNRNRRQKGVYQLSPIGGAIEVDDFKYLSTFQYKLEKPDSHDLRLSLPPDEVPAFREWFYKRKERETNPFREIYEELVEEETAVLTVLKLDDVRMRFAGIVEDIKATERKGMTGIMTQYFLEIFEVDILAKDILLTLKSALPNSGVVWVDEAIARQGNALHMEFDGQVREVALLSEYLFKNGNV
jgi:hypothetical protein